MKKIKVVNWNMETAEGDPCEVEITASQLDTFKKAGWVEVESHEAMQPIEAKPKEEKK